MTTAPLTLLKFSAAGEPAGQAPVPAAFTERIRHHVVYLAVVRQLANARVGTQSTLTKGEVRGGGKKPWKQKHTGRARQGSTRNPHWPGGGVSFGPKPRKYTSDMPVAVRRLALKSALAGKTRQGAVSVLEALNLPAGKTAEVAAPIGKVAPTGLVLMITASPDPRARRAFRNIGRAWLESAASVSTYDVMKARHVVVVQDALAALVARCGSPPAEQGN